jgi:uncharacterized membrane protein
MLHIFLGNLLQVQQILWRFFLTKLAIILQSTKCLASKQNWSEVSDRQDITYMYTTVESQKIMELKRTYLRGPC